MWDFFVAIADASTWLAQRFCCRAWPRVSIEGIADFYAGRLGAATKGGVSESRLGESQELTVCAASDKARVARGNLTRKVVPKGEVSSTITEPPWA
jgi:hypothetical protein